MKIIVCGLKKIPSNGGVECGAEETNLRLVDAGLDLQIYCRAEKYGKYKYRNISIYGIRYWHNKYLCYFSYMARVFLANLKDPNIININTIIHIHTPSINGIWALLYKICGFKVVLHSHGLEWKASKWPCWFKTIMKLSERLALFSSDIILCISKEEKLYYKKLLKKQNISLLYLPNGIPIYYPSNSLKMINHTEIKINAYYLFVGRIVPQKRVHDLINAYRKSGSSKQLVIVGEGSYSTNYAEKIRKLSSNNFKIIFTGQLTRRQVFSLYKYCYAYILPSDHEGCPNSLLEAISFNCLCIVSDITAHREIGSDKLIYFKVRDSESLAMILLNLEQSYEYYSVSKARISEIANNWPTWDEIAAKVLKCYNKLLKKG